MTRTSSFRRFFKCRAKRRPGRIILSCWIILWGSGRLSPAPGWDYRPSPGEAKAIEEIRAASLRAHLSFLASDLLGGRPTPSPGQSISAEYIASQFRRAGLEPLGDNGFFQGCKLKALVPNPEGFRLTIVSGNKTVAGSPERFDVNALRKIDLESAPVVKIPAERPPLSLFRGLKGKVVVTEFPLQSAGTGTSVLERDEFFSRLAGFGPSLVVLIDRSSTEATGYFNRAVIAGPEPIFADGPRNGYLTVTVNDPAIVMAFDAMRSGDTAAFLSLHLETPITRLMVLNNVLGLLRGSDPELRNSYVLVSAHYDGTGSRYGAAGDRIWNAANDNASGTSAVIEIAGALATLESRPRRSVIFAAFFGEEKGSLGARWYLQHPAVPLEKTVADINLEQLGRVDSSQGDQRGKVVVTGFDYSEVGQIFKLAGALTGVAAAGYGHEPDPYFERSDNFPFAERGIPAHTVCVALEFPDYHGAGDEWEKIDFENMEKTARMIALSILITAQSRTIPQWLTSSPQAEPFLRARQSLNPH